MEYPKELPTNPELLARPGLPFLHRDLSWIQFNERVLLEARSRTNPLLMRLRFLAITASNLDEFFMIRYSSLLRSISATKEEEKRAALLRIQKTILQETLRFGFKQVRTLKDLRSSTENTPINIHFRAPPGTTGHTLGRAVFDSDVLPHLVQKASFKVQDLAQMGNLEMLVYLRPDLIFEVPKTIPPVHFRQNGADVDAFFLDDLLITHLTDMLPMKERPGVLRITRDADYSVDLTHEDPETIPDVMRKTIGSRERGRLVRVQWAGKFPKSFLEEMPAALRIDPGQLMPAPLSLCLHGLFSFSSNAPGVSHLDNPPLQSMTPLPFQEGFQGDTFQSLKACDFVLHQPYDSFDAFVSFMKKCCLDPQVESIEQTIYRTDTVSGLLDHFKTAASTGKKVRVILELRARFDEANNLLIAEDLKKAGVEVSFGFGNLKLHAKIALVTRREGSQLVRYTHLSTGNYNAKTARTYTDISILTANPEVGEDARHFLDSVLRGHAPSTFKRLVAAPHKLHSRIMSLIKIETEAAAQGKRARIVAKVNALVDEKVIDALYQASQSGVDVDLIVRGACSLIPGVKGLSERIRVISIVDRLLEHSRLYYFENSGSIYLSSADWMPRNFFSRLEIAFPVLDQRIHRYIVDVVIPGYLNDNVKARRLTSSGVWEKVPKGIKEHRAQKYFENLAIEKYRGTPLFEHKFFGSPD